MCIFADAYKSNVGVARKALLFLSLLVNSAKFLEGGRSILLSLGCVCYLFIAYLSGVRVVPCSDLMVVTVPSKVSRNPQVDGHEYISLMPFLIV